MEIPPNKWMVYDGFFHGKIKNEMDDLGVRLFQETPEWSVNRQMFALQHVMCVDNNYLWYEACLTICFWAYEDLTNSCLGM